ncbi:V-set and immunoglobulin domain-containing protein 1-like [Centroberyx affinis]|uniref:V-set and immunoglobulin domain-containing protein 1-like n=1 Tax=Centroberyx affinis TaxID=166261 RepID=UPI003A5C00A1
MFFKLFVVSLLTFLRTLHVSGCDPKCTDKPVFNPSRLIVRHGDRASAICTVYEHACPHDDIVTGLEVSVGEITKNGTKISWKVDNMTQWESAPKCYYSLTLDTDTIQCRSTLALTIYQPPDSVSISYVNHSGPVLEGHQYTLQCNVQDVAPVQNLAVTFFRGQAALGPPQSRNNTKKTPVTEIFTLNINPSREHDRLQYWCEAKLDLGPEGPQGPEGPHVVKSNKLTTSVHYLAHEKQAPSPHAISITAGDTLQLNCSAMGNPSPSYSWTLPKALSPSNESVLTIDSVDFDHEGQYICVASNNLGNITVMFNVDVQVDLLPIIAGLVAAAVVVIMGVSCFVYTSHYRHTRMGHYRLKDVFRLRRSTHVAVPNGVD